MKYCNMLDYMADSMIEQSSIYWYTEHFGQIWVCKAIRPYKQVSIN